MFLFVFYFLLNMAEKSGKKLSLRVEEPDPSHVGRNIITLDRETKEGLGVTSGDIVEIQGIHKTAAVIWPARQEDEGKGIIRMDNLIRRNAGIGLGEKVIIKKAEYAEAKRVILAPTQEVRIIASGYDRILKKNFIGRPLHKGDRVLISVFGSGFIYQVIDTNPRDIVKVTDFTQFILKEEPIKDSLAGIPRIAYEDIGGLSEQVQKVREMIELPMKHPEIFRKLGISPPKGVLLYGPPGTGKTLLAKAVANETQAHFISISSPSIMSKFVGEAEERIREVFKEAEKNAPSIIFFDEIDAIAPKRDEVVGEVERRVVAQILSAMDGMEARGQVIVIGATNRVNSIDEALRRPGRFDREIEIGVPSKKDRREILQIHTRGMPVSPSLDWDNLKKAKISIENDIKSIKKKKEILDGLYKISSVQEIERSLDKLSDEEKNEINERLTSFEKNHIKKAISDIIENKKDKERIKVIIIDLLNCNKISDRIKLLKNLSPDDYSNVDSLLVYILIDYFAGITHGFVGADLEALAKESAMKALRRYLPRINLEDETIPPEVLESLEVNKGDFLEALKDVQPSALREVAIEIPNVKWKDIGGLEKIKEELKQAIEWPLKKPEAFQKMGIKPPSGVLFYGPPGTGKTLLAKAIATESEANFISIKGPQLISMWVGESEKGIRKIFQRARQVAPVIIFFDEIDAIAARRSGNGDSGVNERVVNQLLTELDGVEELKGVVFIAATNRPDLLDRALLRPGRIDKIINIPAPDIESRKNIFKIHTSDTPLAKNVSIGELAEKTEGYSGADIDGLVREAALIAMQEANFKPTEIQLSHFEQAMQKIVPSINKETIDAYAAFKNQVVQAFRPSYVR